MARSGYQSARKDWGEMYEHELEECAAELDAIIDGLIVTDNATTAERDRLAAENAELKARYLHVAELNHNQVSMVRADCAGLAAANSTLDALREVVPEDDRDKVFCSHCKTATRWHSEPDDYGKYCDDCDNENCDIPEGDELQSVIRAILYPQPAALAEEKKNG